VLTPESYTIALSLFYQLLGAVYFFAFGAFLFQIKGLIGKNGILPVTEYLHLIRRAYPKQYYQLFPTVFWWNSSDRALMAVIGLGTAISVFLMFGVAPSLCLLLLYVLYLSIVSAGQDFLSFGWEGFLLEITINAFFISLSSSPNLLLWISLNLVLFRFHFQGGIVKLQSQDPNWRNLTGVAYHYLTQPLPNTIAWYAYKLPMWFQKASTLLMLIIEIIIPFGMLGPDWMRFAVFLCFIGLQLAIWFTGNFSFLNHLTAVLCMILVSNNYLPFFTPPSITATPLPIDIINTSVGAFLITLQLLHLWQAFFPNRRFYNWLHLFSPYHLANRYGIFAVMTTKRYEIIFEGSEDGVEWKEYLFRYKPSEVNRRPRRISPYQPRLDWQAWFLPFGRPNSEPWMEQFIYHLLKGTPEVLNLLRGNPFPDKPPTFVRALAYDYVYTTFKEKKDSGAWWKREYAGIFCHPMHLR